MKLIYYNVMFLMAFLGCTTVQKNTVVQKKSQFIEIRSQSDYLRQPAYQNKNQSFVEITHFSNDRRYLGYFTHDYIDGYGSYNITYRILDLKNDSYIKTAKYNSEEDQNTADILKLNKSIIQKYNLIDIKSNPALANGNISKLEISIDQKSAPYNFSFSKNGKKYPFQIQHLANPDEPQKMSCIDMIGDGPMSPPMIQISVNNLVVYKDKFFPKSRGCLLSYGPHEIYSVGDFVIFFVGASDYGFEGVNDTRILSFVVPSTSIR